MSIVDSLSGLEGGFGDFFSFLFLFLNLFEVSCIMPRTVVDMLAA